MCRWWWEESARGQHSALHGHFLASLDDQAHTANNSFQRCLSSCTTEIARWHDQRISVCLYVEIYKRHVGEPNFNQWLGDIPIWPHSVLWRCILAFSWKLSVKRFPHGLKFCSYCVICWSWCLGPCHERASTRRFTRGKSWSGFWLPTSLYADKRYSFCRNNILRLMS